MSEELPGRAAVCENIGPRQRAYRLKIAIGAFLVGDVLSFALLFMRAAQGLRLLVFLPFVVAAISLFETKQRTCVLLAAKGVRNMDDGEQRVTDPNFLRQAARQSWRILALSFVLATVLTLALWLAPAIG